MHDQEEECINLAQYYFDIGNYSFSKKILKSTLAKDPNNSKANELLAYIVGNEGDTEKSHSLLRKISGNSDVSPEALYYLGSYFLQSKNYIEAKSTLEKSLQKSGGFFEVFHDLATACAHLGQTEDALFFYSKAAVLNNNSYVLFFNMARLYDELKQPQEALRFYDESIRLNPNYAEAWTNKGVILNQLHRYEEAIYHHSKAIDLNPNYVEAWSNKGVTLNDLMSYSEAIEAFNKALEISPDHSKSWTNKGVALKNIGQLRDSIYHHEKAIFFDSEFAEGWSNLGATLNEMQLFEKALCAHDKAINLSPGYPAAWSNKGVTLTDLHQYEDALNHFNKAINLDQDFIDAKFNKALLNLFLKKFSEGWADYPARLDVLNFKFPLKLVDTPIWDGVSKCKDLLVVGEQGIGDEIFYTSLLNKIIDKCDQVTMITDKRLVTLFSRSIPSVIFIDKDAFVEPGKYDAQIPSGNLPGILNFNPVKNQNGVMPYLSCNLELTKNIKCNSPFQEKFTCGIAWKSSNKKIGHHKSIKLTDLKNILQVPNCQFVNLQYGDVAEDIEEARLLTGVQLSSLDYIDPFKDIDGLLSIIQACDIIVTTSNITAHLAGALGKKTLLLVPYSQGKIWYWHHEPVNSWYPTVHQFFQSKNFDWNDAINCVAKELIREVDGKN